MYTKRWATSPREYGVTVDRGVKIQMPDGVRLDAEIHRPSAAGKFPVILGISPYPHHHQSAPMRPVGFTGVRANQESGDPTYFVRRGYVHAVVNLRPVLTGSNVSIAESVVYFGDLITKNVIDLDDPGNAALIDLTALQREQLRTEFSNRFLDSLRISGLQLRIANDVWLRSAEANIQVQGTLQVDKTRRVYALTGTLDAPRGTYTLRIGPINSDFVVDQGTVTYYGTADLNALLNVQAHHQVRTLNGDDFNVVAAITGSILEPKVDLSSPGRSLSDRDLASYVLFGQSEAQLTSTQSGSGGAASAAVAALTGLLSAELQRSVINGGSRSLTSLTIRPGIAPGAASAATQFAAGWQLGRWFVTFDAGVCLSQGSSLQKRNFGASLEYRISRAFRFQAAAEPVQTCATSLAADVFTTLSRYQLGWNFLWSRDY